jgi:BON domain
MAREDWRDRDEMRRRGRDRYDFGQADYSETYAYDPDRRAGYRAEDEYRAALDDYGQADYSRDYDYEPQRRRAQPRYPDADRDYGRRMDEGDYRAERGEPRSWLDRAEAFFAGHPRREHERQETRPRRRRGPSDRVLWAVIMERLDDARVDTRDVDVVVEDAEVTLNGTVRHKADKRRVEDIADIEGVDHVQNNLRVRDRGHWAFI